MTSLNLRHLLGELRKLIAAGAETYTLLYFLDHIHQLTPKTHSQLAQIQALQTQNSQNKAKLHQSLKENKKLQETLAQMQFQLEVRLTKNQKLQKELKDIRQKELRRQRIERKQHQKNSRQQLSQCFLLTDLEQEEQAEATKDQETILKQLQNNNQPDQQPLSCWSRETRESRFTHSDQKTNDSFSEHSFEFGDNGESKEQQEDCQTGAPKCVLGDITWLLTKSSQLYQILKRQ